MFKNLSDATKAMYGKGLEERKGAQECVNCGKKTHAQVWGQFRKGKML